MIEKERFPQIRFKSFSEEWELCKLKDISERVIRKNINLESALPLTISAQYGLVDQTTFFNNQVAGQNISNYYLIRKGEFAYNKSTSQDYPAGAVKRLDRYEMGVLSTLYILFRLQNTVSSDYLAAYFDSNCWHKEIAVRAAEGARNHGLLNISSDDFFDIDIRIPRNVIEQESIGILLKKTDQLILEKREKLKKLLNLKKTMLKKMFPEDHADVPEIRFEKFKEPWKKYLFEDITYLSGIRNKDNIDYDSYSITNEDGFVPQSEQFENGGTMRDADKRMYIIVSPHSFAYNPARINVGSIGYQNLKRNVIVSSLYEVFKTVHGVNDRFLFHWFRSEVFHKKIERFQEGGVRLYFYYDKLCKCSIFLPTDTEQIQIGKYFDDIDQMLAVYNQELIKLQNIKKAVTEKIFI